MKSGRMGMAVVAFAFMVDLCYLLVIWCLCSLPLERHLHKFIQQSNKKIAMRKNFSELFELIYKKFIENYSGKIASLGAFATYLGHTHNGKVNAWKKGQWPSAEDIAVIHDKLGFDFRWLLTGEGNPLEIPPKEPDSAEMEHLRLENKKLRADLAEADRLNRKLATRMFIDGVGDKGAVTNIGKAADGHE